ncbi:MFS transporter [Nitriliruptoraceae bacterium ZYF776]|nr:MFS transporter [Profundirhabdus halotolerans]
MLWGFVATALVLVAFYFAVQLLIPALLLVFGVGVLGSLVAINLQIRLMDAAGEAQMLGAALNHSALNVANGLGAFFGSVIISAGYGYRATSLVGVVLATLGLLIFSAGLVYQRRSTVPAEAAASR